MDLSKERFFILGGRWIFAETPPLLIEKIVRIPYEVRRW